MSELVLEVLAKAKLSSELGKSSTTASGEGGRPSRTARGASLVVFGMGIATVMAFTLVAGVDESAISAGAPNLGHLSRKNAP